MAGGVGKVLCRYFMHGACREGDSCVFSHDPHSKPSMVCKYYKLGCCSYGSRCRYDHIRDDKVSTSEKSSSKKPNQSHSLQMSNSTAAPCPVNLHTGTSLDISSQMTVLDKHQSSCVNEFNVAEKRQQSDEDWVHAAEFVPGQMWMRHGFTTPVVDQYCDANDTAAEALASRQLELCSPKTSSSEQMSCLEVQLCPYAAHGHCPYADQCVYVHGDVCDLCHCAVLSPFDPDQQQRHTAECVRRLQQDMELSFAVQRSESQVCGICMEVVWQKQPPSAQRFGILTSCSHVYCLDCIRKWRSARQFENIVIRSCPECRVKCDFVTPSKYWIEDANEKQQLIDAYKQSLCKKPCKYFDQGRAECPFADSCFYLHAYPDGRVASPQVLRRRFRQNADGEVTVVRRVQLWDFVDDVQEQRTRAAEQHDERATDENWQRFFARLLELGYELPSDEDDDNVA